MSTGNNQGDTLVSKKRKRIVRGYIHPIGPEIKKFDFFTGQEPYSGTYRLSNSWDLSNIYNPIGKPSTGKGSFELIQMVNPDSGTTAYERVGRKYNLKYIKFKGHISVNYLLPFTIHYKLVLIKSDRNYTGFAEFCNLNMNNYEPYPNVSTPYNNEYFCRHNFYKLYKNYEGMSDHHTSITTIASGTISPNSSAQRPTFITTLGAQPTISYFYPQSIKLDSTDDESLNCQNMLPINSSITVNDNIDINGTYVYLCLMTDHGIGLFLPNMSTSGTQLYYRGTDIWMSSLLRFNLFGICYYTDY